MGPRSADINDKTVGTRIRMERLAAGMSQQVLAESLGVSFQQVQKYEKGVNRISAGRIRQICEALQLPFDRIVGESGESKAAPNPMLAEIQRFLATKEGMSLMTAFNDITNDQVRKELIVLVKSIAASSSRLRPKPSESRASVRPRKRQV